MMIAAVLKVQRVELPVNMLTLFNGRKFTFFNDWMLLSEGQRKENRNRREIAAAADAAVCTYVPRGCCSLFDIWIDAVINRFYFFFFVSQFWGAIQISFCCCCLNNFLWHFCKVSRSKILNINQWLLFFKTNLLRRILNEILEPNSPFIDEAICTGCFNFIIFDDILIIFFSFSLELSWRFFLNCFSQ